MLYISHLDLAKCVMRAVVKSGLSGNLVIDCEGRMKVRKERAAVLAQLLGGVCVRLSEMNGDNIKTVINA